MSVSTNKKAIIQRFDRETLYGYLNPGTFLQATGVELLNLSGNLLLAPYSEIRMVSFVREFEAPDPGERRLFTTRPKTPGLWVRMRFRDNEQMDGLLANNLLLLDPYGFSVTPPDPSSNSQRIFVPKQALKEFQVLAVVGSPQRRMAPPRVKPAAKEQMGLFEQP
ncbi:MAG: hypothetical protein IT165_23255 [Bryobacterales bacterium]|nr:hypothetical protein [Bryobacterales bacterium]